MIDARITGVDSPMLPAPVTDRLWRRAPTPYRACFHVLGVPLQFAANSEAVVEVAREAFGGFGAGKGGFGPIRVRAYVHDEPAAGDRGECVPIVRSQEEYLFVWSGSSFGFADRSNDFGTVFVDRALLSQPDLVRTWFIECLGLYLAGRYRPAVVHAAAVVHEDRCVLLTGAHGAGKSTLAYACLRGGLAVLAEDVVFVESGRDGMEGWGHPTALHLLPDSTRLFPELLDSRIVRQLNGEGKLRVSVAAMRPGAAAASARIAGALVLGRCDQLSRLLCADAASVVRALTQFEGDPILDSTASEAAARHIAAGPIGRLEVGADLDRAAGLVREWLEERCAPTSP